MPEQNLGLGFLCAAISVLGFGSNFVPVKKYEMGDGMFFQLTQALGIFTVGIVVQLIRGYQSVFRPLAMLGGFLWCTGNCMSTPIIKCIGMALGLLIWGACNMITGWCMGEWGLFWVKKSDPPAYPSLNVAGALIALVATSIYFFVKPADDSNEVEKLSNGYKQIGEDTLITPHTLNSGPRPITDHRKTLKSRMDRTDNKPENVLRQVVNSVEDPYLIHEDTAATSWIDNLNASQKRLAGVSMSVVAGVLYGSNFAPPTHLMDDQHSTDGNHLHNSPHGIDYVFSHFTGILLTSLTWFLVYCWAMKNKPQINNRVILPGWLSGVLWGIADASWFIANDNLGLTTAFPIITTGPGLVASLWGVCIFGEVTGKRNLIVLMVAFTISLIAVALITLSKTL